MNVLEQFLTGRAARREQDAADQLAAMNSFMQKQGGAIFAGDQNALTALAGMGPQGLETAFNVQGQLDQRQRAGVADQRAARADQRAEWGFHREMEDYAKGISAEQAAAEAAQVESAVKGAMMAETPQQFDAMMEQLGQPELKGQFANREALAAQYLPMAEVLKMRAGAGPDALTKGAPTDTMWVDPNDPRKGVVPIPGVQPKSADGGATEGKIARMGELGIPREEAIRIVDLTEISRDPVTGETVLIDKRTGGAFGGASPQPQAQPALSGGLSFGQAFPDAASAFGASGAIKGAVNTATDAIGMGAVFPDVMQAQADIDAWAENTRTQMLSSYNGKDSVWLTQQIDKLIPRAGSVFTGVDEAKAKIVANARQMEMELRAVESQIQNGRLKPDDKKELIDKATALRAGVSSSQQLLTAINGNGGADQDSIDLMNQLLEGE